jgi:hypothetical protein
MLAEPYVYGVRMPRSATMGPSSSRRGAWAVVSLGRGGGAGTPGDQPAGDLARQEIAALAFETMADGAGVRVLAVDVEGTIHELAKRPGHCGARCVHVEILGELLARGLRSRGSLLVAADGCSRLVERLRAAFAQGVVLVPDE